MLAVSSNRRGNQDLWILPAGGGEMMPLTSDATADWSPQWSPDGREILSYFTYAEDDSDIRVMDVSERN
jgi:Tol biopolymer transport system component